MAKKVVATISSGTKGWAKVITSAGTNNKKISFKSQMMPIEKAEEFVKNLKK